MMTWREFSHATLEISATAERLLKREEVALLATISKTGRPRIHPFVPKVVDGALLAFIMNSSPKIHDLYTRKQYSIHTTPGAEDEECFLSGEAVCCDDNTSLREKTAQAMGFATGIDEHHILFEFYLDRALWTRWLDFGTPDHRPEYTRWRGDQKLSLS